MADTDVYEIDELLKGRVPKGKSLVYYIQPGVEGELFGLQTMHNTLKSGWTGVLVASSTSPDVIKNQLKEMGWDVDAFKKRLFFVDAYSPLILTPSNEKYVVSNPENIHDFSRLIVNLLKEMPQSIVLFSSLSTIIDLCGEKETIEAVRKWNGLASLYGHVIVYNFTAWPYSKETLNLIQKALFNGVVCIGSRDEHTFERYFRIIKSDWKLGHLTN